MRLAETHFSGRVWTLRICVIHRYAVVTDWGCVVRHNAKHQCLRGVLVVQGPPFYWTAEYLRKLFKRVSRVSL